MYHISWALRARVGVCGSAPRQAIAAPRSAFHDLARPLPPRRGFGHQRRGEAAGWAGGRFWAREKRPLGQGPTRFVMYEL